MLLPSLFTVQYLQTTHKNKTNIVPRAAVACNSGACLVDGEHVALDTETFQQELGELRLGGAESEDDHDVRGTDARELSDDDPVAALECASRLRLPGLPR